MHRRSALVWIPALIVLLAGSVLVEVKQATPAADTPTAARWSTRSIPYREA